MTPEPISVRQWQEKFQARAFDSKDLDTQRQAGWRDWYCHFDALAGRLKQIAPVVMGIQESLILDNYLIWFANIRSSGRKAVYDYVRFEPLDSNLSGRIFRVDYKNPGEPEKWTLYTERFGFHAPEYGCAHVREIVKYISAMAYELEQNIRPSFLDEKAAAVGYILGCDTLYPSGALQREGEHSYSFLAREDGRRKIVYVAHSLKDVPPDFQMSRTMQINGLYVYCPEDTEKSPSPHEKMGKQSQKRKKVQER